MQGREQNKLGCAPYFGVRVKKKSLWLNSSKDKTELDGLKFNSTKAPGPVMALQLYFCSQGQGKD